jgi:hypothetical protein
MAGGCSLACSFQHVRLLLKLTRPHNLFGSEFTQITKIRSLHETTCGCSSSNIDRDAQAIRLRCEQQGMIAQPGLGGSLQCGARNVSPGNVRAGPNPNQINPSRGGL